MLLWCTFSIFIEALLTRHLQLELSSLTGTWLGWQILGTLGWTVEVWMESPLDFSWRFVKVVNGLFLLLPFTRVGNIQIFVGHKWLPDTLFLFWRTLTLLGWGTLTPFLLFGWSVLFMSPQLVYWHHIGELLLYWGLCHSKSLSVPCTVLFLFLQELLDGVVA